MDSDDEPQNLTVISDQPTSGLSHSAFFSAIESSSTVAPILRYFESTEREEVNSLIEKLNKVKCRRLFGSLLPLLVKIIEDETYNEEEEAIPSLQFIKLSADLLTVHISIISNEASDEVFEMATLLHDSSVKLL
jgi:hypothetical protein